MTNGSSSLLTHAALEALSNVRGDSFFVLDGGRFAANFKALHVAFADYYADVKIGYSYKTNYTPQLCRIAHALGGYAEVVSEMEYNLAKRLEIPGPRIIFNGPFKAWPAFEDAAVTGATLNLDSKRDLDMLGAVAGNHPDKDVAVVLRCNFALDEGGDISRFGMDTDGPEFAAAIAMIAAAPNLRLKGLHCHFPNRDLTSFGTRAEAMIKLLRHVFPDAPPEILNIGGGYFSNMPDSLRAKFDVPPATFADYGALVGKTLSKAFEGTKAPTLFLEPGTAVVADTQAFYTRVISVKTVQGKGFATVAGSSFDISPTARSRVLPVTPIYRDDGTARATDQTFDVVGYTCIEKDILTEGLNAGLKVGDFLCYNNVGSYSVVMRPPFILPANPVLYVDEHGGDLQLIKRRQTTEDVFANFVF